jgi:hypothetical protein
MRTPVSDNRLSALSASGSNIEEITRMAKNKTPGDNRRSGAVKGRSQIKNKLTGTWTKRDTKSGKFLDVKEDPTPFKGVRKVKKTAAKKAAAKKAATKKTAAKKKAVKKSVAKKTVTRKATKKRTTTRKAPARKAGVRKAGPAKKAGTAKKRAPAKKRAAAKKR